MYAIYGEKIVTLQSEKTIIISSGQYGAQRQCHTAK